VGGKRVVLFSKTVVNHLLAIGGTSPNELLVFLVGGPVWEGYGSPSRVDGLEGCSWYAAPGGGRGVRAEVWAKIAFNYISCTSLRKKIMK